VLLPASGDESLIIAVMSRLARGRLATGQHQVPRPMTSTVWSFREGICFLSFYGTD
jgi:hypothetical protein